MNDSQLERAMLDNMYHASKVNNLLAAAMLMLNAWDECGMPNNATRDRISQALEEFGK